jgi:hypothetical protein
MNELKQRYSFLKDEELKKIILEDHDNYTEEAIEAAKNELTSRGIKIDSKNFFKRRKEYEDNRNESRQALYGKLSLVITLSPALACLFLISSHGLDNVSALLFVLLPAANEAGIILAQKGNGKAGKYGLIINFIELCLTLVIGIMALGYLFGIR